MISNIGFGDFGNRVLLIVHKIGTFRRASVLGEHPIYRATELYYWLSQLLKQYIWVPIFYYYY